MTITFPYEIDDHVYVPRKTFHGTEADEEIVWGYDVRTYGTLVIFKSGGQANIEKVYKTKEEAIENS